MHTPLTTRLPVTIIKHVVSIAFVCSFFTALPFEHLTKATSSEPTRNVIPNKAIIIMGASCSGKSTLSKKLLSSLDEQWKLVELDAIEDTLKEQGKDTSDESLIDAVISQANALLAAGWNVIIDTNMYHEQLRSLAAADKKFIFVYCPLEVLLERNARRDLVLKRPAKRSAYARAYVEKTFANFEQCTQFDIRVDSSTGTIEPSQLIQTI